MEEMIFQHEYLEQVTYGLPRNKPEFEHFEQFPRIIAYDAKDADTECPICLEKYQDGDVQLILPCSHIFHEKCALHWLKKKSTCPLDRSKVCKR